MMVWGLLMLPILGISSFGHERPTHIDRTVIEAKHGGIADGWAGSPGKGCLQDLDRTKEFTNMSTHFEVAERVREDRIPGNLLARMVNPSRDLGEREPSTGLKRYVSGKMRNMCKSKTLRNKEGAQHAQIVEMRKAYDSGKMINMRTFCDKNRGDDQWVKNEQKKSAAELGTVQQWHTSDSCTHSDDGKYSRCRDLDR